MKEQHPGLRGALGAAGVGLLVAAVCVAALPAAAKLKPEEVVARHLASIGSAEAIAAVTSRHIGGTTMATFRQGGTGQIEGQAQLISEGAKSLIAMEFGALDYPHERMAYDGKTMTVGNLKPGLRSPLCSFLYTHEMLFRQGLVGGTLSTAWPLLDLKERNPNLNYSGTRKIEGQELHELRYRPRKDSADVQVTMYFELETFRHVRTVYRMTIAAPMGARPEDSASQRESRFQIVEEFGDHRPEGGLTLPHAYKLQLTIEGQGRSILMDWAFTLSSFDYNQAIEEGTFNAAK